MRAVARLLLFYIIAFFFFLAAGTSVEVMREWLTATQAFTPSSFSFSSSLFRSLSFGVPPAAYGSALLVLASGAGRGVGSFTTGMTVFAATGLLLFSATYGALTPAAAGRSTQETRIAEKSVSPGLIVDLQDATIVFVRAGGDLPGGIAVEVKRDAPMRIIPATNAVDLLNRSSYRSPILGSEKERRTLMASLADDFAGSARRLATAYAAGPVALLAHAFALALLLSAFSPLAGATRWPLADLALCALVFRGVLALEGFVSSEAVFRSAEQSGFGIPAPFVIPALLGGLGLFLAAGGTLLRLARHGNDRDG
jgi:hypothetical protein